MATASTVQFHGKSGDVFDFIVQDLTKAPTISEGVYIVSRREENFTDATHEIIIYIGQSVDITTKFPDHFKKDCFEKFNANCLCIHVEESEPKRQAIREDLLRNYDVKCL
jgi:hypothetical protein